MRPRFDGLSPLLQWLPALILLSIVLLVLGAPLLTSFDPLRTNTANILQAPDAIHLLGTDMLGRDVFSRVLYGGRNTLAMAMIATGIAVCGGGFLGIVAGFWLKQWRIVDRLLDAWLALPALLIALIVLTLLGRGLLAISLALGMAQVAPFARVVRSTMIAGSVAGYVEAARSLGASRWHILWRHLVPYGVPVWVRYAAMIFGYTIMNGAALSFLGLGGEPAIPDWGVMLADGRQGFRQAPWVALAPGVMITLTIFSIHWLIDVADNRRL